MPSNTTTNDPRSTDYQSAREDFLSAGQQTAASGQSQAAAAGAAAENIATEEERRKARERLLALASSVGQTAQAQQQADLAAALARQATGAEEGAGQLQLRRALEATQAATAAQLGGVRGMNPAAVQRLAAQQQSAQAQAIAGQSAEVALEEQKAARQQLGGLLGQMRGQTASEQQLAANITEAVRSGDQAAINAAVQAAQAQRQGDIQAQAQALGLVDAEGRIDLGKLNAQTQLALQQMQGATQMGVAQLGSQTQQAVAQMNVQTQLEIARLNRELQEKLAEIDRKYKQGLINDQRAEDERKYWRDLYVNMTLGAQAASGAAMMQSSIGQGRAKGGRIDGKGLLPGDHPANDVVPAMLSPGEIVLPRSIAQAEDAPEKAAAFVRALQRSETKPLSRRAAAEKIAKLEAELAALRAMRAQKEDR